MTEKSVFGRVYRHLPLPGVTIGVDVSKDGGRIAVALCREEDTFSRATGRYIVNTLFDENDQTLRAAQFTRNVFSIPYLRGFPSEEVIQPLLDFINDYLNERAIYRVLRELFEYGATTKEKAEAAAKEYKNPRIATLYKKVVEELDKREKLYFEKVKTNAQFDRFFFSWSGSANAVINGIATFAQIMYEEHEIESEISGITNVLADAKKADAGKEAISPEQIKAWESKLERLNKALAKTKEVTGAKLREDVQSEKTAKPVKALPRASSAPGGARQPGVAPCLDVLDRVKDTMPGNPPPLPGEASDETPIDVSVEEDAVALPED